jgi:hypothetical protein
VANTIQRELPHAEISTVNRMAAIFFKRNKVIAKLTIRMAVNNVKDT